MATISIDIPDAEATRVLNAIALRFNYNAATDGTKAAFAKQQLIKWVKSEVSAQESEIASQAAAQTARNNVSSINIT